MMGILTGTSGILRAEDPDRPYECQTCHATFDVEYFSCPECGGYSVERPW